MTEEGGCGIISFVMEKIVEQGLLFDFYAALLTEHQQEIYGACVNEDLSLAEAAECFGISRQAVHDLLKRCDAMLQEYEEKLGLIRRFTEERKKLNGIRKMIESGRAEDGSRLLSPEESEKLLDGIDSLLDEI